jgi:hypothetical protein
MLDGDFGFSRIQNRRSFLSLQCIIRRQHQPVRDMFTPRYSIRFPRVIWLSRSTTDFTHQQSIQAISISIISTVPKKEFPATQTRMLARIVVESLGRAFPTRSTTATLAMTTTPSSFCTSSRRPHSCWRLCIIKSCVAGCRVNIVFDDNDARFMSVATFLQQHCSQVSATSFKRPAMSFLPQL